MQFDTSTLQEATQQLAMNDLQPIQQFSKYQPEDGQQVLQQDNNNYQFESQQQLPQVQNYDQEFVIVQEENIENNPFIYKQQQQFQSNTKIDQNNSNNPLTNLFPVSFGTQQQPQYIDQQETDIVARMEPEVDREEQKRLVAQRFQQIRKDKRDYDQMSQQKYQQMDRQYQRNQQQEREDYIALQRQKEEDLKEKQQIIKDLRAKNRERQQQLIGKVNAPKPRIPSRPPKPIDKKSRQQIMKEQNPHLYFGLVKGKQVLKQPPKVLEWVGDQKEPEVQEESQKDVIIVDQ